jgi:hypothetical protein
MVWLGLGLGIIDIWKADKLFFQLFENIFERAVASVCHSGTSRPGFEAVVQPKMRKSSNLFLPTAPMVAREDRCLALLNPSGWTIDSRYPL